MKILLSIHFVFFCLICACQTNQINEAFETFEFKEGDTVYHMKKYVLCVYTRVDSKPSISDERATNLQNEHLAFQGKLAEENKLCLSGPFADDGEWRGILVLNVPSLTEAENLIQNDPLVKAGRLNYILKPWWGAIGTQLY